MRGRLQRRARVHDEVVARQQADRAGRGIHDRLARDQAMPLTEQNGVVGCVDAVAGEHPALGVQA